MSEELADLNTMNSGQFIRVHHKLSPYLPKLSPLSPLKNDIVIVLSLFSPPLKKKRQDITKGDSLLFTIYLCNKK